MVIPGVETHTPPVVVPAAVSIISTQPAVVEAAPPALILPSTSPVSTGVAIPEVPMTINSVLNTAPVIQIPVAPAGGQFVLPSLP